MCEQNKRYNICNTIRLTFFAYPLWALLLLAVCSGCNTEQARIYSKTELRQLIIPANADRTGRYKAVRLAIKQYPEHAPEWLGQALLNTLDIEVADFLLEKLARLNKQAAFEYIALFRPITDDQAVKKRTTLENAYKANHPDYFFSVLRSIWKNINKSESEKAMNTAVIWSYICENCEKAKITNWINKADFKNKSFDTLKYCLENLDYIPVTDAEFIQCLSLVNEIKSGKLCISDKLTSLKDNAYQFSIADSGLINAVSQTRLAFPRNTVENNISNFVNSSKHLSRPPAYKNAVDDKPDDFESQKESLSITDLHKINLIIEYLQRGDFNDIVAALSKAAIKSEIGGLAHYKDDMLNFQYYQPGKAVGHHRYIESKALLNDAIFSIARWHIHDQRESGRNLAGPGLDDINYATSFKTSIIIITLVEDSNDGLKANFDYLNKDGIIIDVGIIDI